MAGNQIEKLTRQIAKLPALGTRSARRIVLHLLKNKEKDLPLLIESLTSVSENIKTCSICGNFDTSEVCSICASETRNGKIVCVVQDVADLWAMERSGVYQGKYHVLGGVLSALDGVLPQDLNITSLEERVQSKEIEELIMALPATVDGQITTQYLLNKFKPTGIKISTLAQGIPVGAELDYMDDGTLELALGSRKNL